MGGESPSRLLRTDPIFLGFAGHIGAGKTSAADYVSSKYGFQYIRYSQILHHWFAAKGTDKHQLQTLGWNVMSTGIQVELNSRLVARIDHTRSAAIDGLRHPIDFQSLSSVFGASFHLIFVEARQEVRFERLRSRFPTFAAFRTAQSHPVESQIDSLKPLAHTILLSDGPFDNFHKRLDDVLAILGVGDRR